jgi:PEP-CTERM motif
MRKFQLAASAALLAFAANPASAAIVVGTAGPPPVTTFEILNPLAPALVSVGVQTSQNNGLDANKVYGFNENQSFTLGSALTVTLPPGGSTNAQNLGQLAAGTNVASHYIFFDPAALLNGAGTITFNRKILAIIRTSSGLDATDAMFGVAGVGYVQGNALRGLEGTRTRPNSVFFAVNDKTLSYDTVAGTPGDSFRVLTGGVPEPATWAFMILGFGLIGGAMRQAKSRQSVNVRFA